jgi:FkbM family methyltransferase
MSAMLKDLRRTARTEGMALHPLKTRAPYLRGYGFTPDVVFDVGVGDGTHWIYRTYPDARFVLIDPQESCAEAVRGKGVLKDFHFHAVAAGATAGTADLKVPCSSEGMEPHLASLRPRTDQSARAFFHSEEIEVPLRPLDEIAVAYPGRAGLSVDTEGYELEVLQGAHDTLSRCDFAILKLTTTARFEGVGAPSAAVALLAEAGLEMRDVMSMGGGTGQTAQPRYLNILFTRWTAS